MGAEEVVGIPQLDKMLAKMPSGTSVALVNDPGVEAEPFLYQCAHHHLEAGRTVIYAVFSRPPSSVQRGMAEFGFLSPGTSSRLRFLDAYSPLMGSTENAAYTWTPGTDPASLAKVLDTVAKENHGAVLILDSVGGVLDQSPPEPLQKAIPMWHQALRHFRLTVALLTKWPYGAIFDRLKDGFDGIINLRGVEDRVLLNNYFVIERTRWSSPPQPRPVLYKAIKPGGVFVYIPKVLVTGPYHAGKSTFVKTLSDTAVSVDRFGTTVALDYGHVTLDGLTADIFGTPGQERFDPLLRTISGQALGVIVLVDATRPDSFPRAKEMMELTGREGLPIIIAANKQDVAGAMSPAKVAELLGAPAHIPVVGCIGSDRESVRKVLRDLTQKIMLKVAA